MKRIYALFTLLFLLCFGPKMYAQVTDTLAIQDFELTPQVPVWTYTGTPNAFLSGTSTASQGPQNSPFGIAASRAWHLVQVSSGNPLVFDNQMIPPGYDSIRVRFRLAAFNTQSASGGGPDNLDYVLMAYSTNGGTTFTNRIRVRGSSSNNCTWPYSATAVAKAFYLPASEIVFQPTTSGLQSTDGYSTVELVFPGSITQLAIRLTPRSSSGSDSWLIDNLVLTGDRSCTPTTASISPVACDSFLSPSGNYVWNTSGSYQDTIMNASSCDSILSISLTVNNSSSNNLTVSECNDYTSPSGKVWTTSNTYLDTIQNAIGCDSLFTIQLTINYDQAASISDTACVSYTSPSGDFTWTASGNYQDTISTTGGCDSVLSIALTINAVDTAVSVSGNTLTASATGASYQWLACTGGFSAIPGATAQTFTPTTSGDYALAVTENGCTDTSACYNVTVVGLEASLAGGIHLWPNPVGNQLHVAVDELREAGTARVFNVRGQQVFERKLAPANQFLLDTQALVPGIYFLEIETGSERVRLKFIRE